MASSSSHPQFPACKRPKMESSSSPPLPPPSISLKTPVSKASIPDHNENPNPNSAIVQSQEDVFLSNSTHLTHGEVVNRRSHNHMDLMRIYRDQYWFLMEELKVLYKDYVWKFGVSPFKEAEDRENAEEAGDDGLVESSETNNNNQLCAFYGCKLKAMVLTSFCQLHILSDSEQLLYKACEYVIKSPPSGPITCMKPILRSMVPALCNVHLQKAQQHVTRALKKAGLNVSSSSKLAPKFHVVVAEYVREIQCKRKAAALKECSGNKIAIPKHERCS